MTLLPFPEYRPDLSDINSQYTSVLSNVIARSDGYGPFQDLLAFTSALPAACRGYFFARNTDGTVALFAGTSTRLYLLDNTTLVWADVSKGGSAYATLSATANWEFEQFNDYVIATQANDAAQKFRLSVASAFSDLSADAPRAAYVAVVVRNVVLSGLASAPFDIAWSCVNAPTTWVIGTNYADQQTIPTGGKCLRVIGGQIGVVMQEAGMKRMTYSPGSDALFSIDPIAVNRGCLAPYSAVTAGERIFFLSAQGFVETTAGGGITPIGAERVDRDFFADYDESQTQLIVAVPDPASNTVVWGYKSKGGLDGQIDKLLTYNYVLQRWTPVSVMGEYLATLARPGLTLEGLDAIAPGAVAVSGAANNGSGLVRLTVASTTGWTTGDIKTISGVGGATGASGTFAITVIDGTHIDLQGSTFGGVYTSGGVVGGSLDAIDFSLDDISTATLPRLSMVDATHKAGFFTGDTLEATLATAEQSGVSRRAFCRGLWVHSDADDAYGSIGGRESQRDTPSYSTEAQMDTRGYVPQLVDARYLRGKIRIPAATDWTYARGIEPDLGAAGAI